MYKIVKTAALALSFVSHVIVPSFGGASISVELFDFIRHVLPSGATILELGSGAATNELARYYTMFSIEHDAAWVNKYNSTYIHAPIVRYANYRWYDARAIARNIPSSYDLILIDGPTGKIGRYGFYHNIALFNTDATMIFDDVQRPAELELLRAVSQFVNRPYRIYNCQDGKKFGVIMSRE